jgi:hypothetical protein
MGERLPVLVERFSASATSEPAWVPRRRSIAGPAPTFPKRRIAGCLF